MVLREYLIIFQKWLTQLPFKENKMNYINGIKNFFMEAFK